MQSRRKILIVTLSVIIGLMFIAAGILVFRGFAAFYRAESELGVKKAELEKLYQRRPFPSSQNLKTENENLEVLNQEMAGLLAAMGRGQIESVDQSPPKFMAQFWETRKDLAARAKDMDVTLANEGDFDFGFGRHMQGNLPAPQDVPRLTQQLKIVQSLCGVLYDSRISELKGIGREEFEVDAVTGAGAQPAAAGGRRRGATVVASLNVMSPNAGLIQEGRLFGNWHFTLSFTAKESALLGVLNGFARSPLFVVVTRVDVAGDDKAFQQSGETAPAGRKPAKDAPAKAVEVGKDVPAALPRDQRVVCGHDVPLTVKMELDVYQFVKAQPAGATPKAEEAK